MATARVELQLTDVRGGPLSDPNVLFEFFSSDQSRHFRVPVPLAGQQTVAITLNDPGNGIYQVTIWPTNYRVIQFFLRITEGGTARRAPVVFPVDPGKVIGISAPPYTGLDAPLQSFLSAATIKGLTGQPLYDSLPPILKAALLNLFTKATATVLGDGAPVWAKLGSMIELDQDRLFAKTTAALLEETQLDPDFHLVDDSLHRDIPPYRVFTSYKTRDSHGNLQLTFSRSTEVASDLLVDMDIDEAQGIEHIFEVLRNFVTSTLTNPYNVREILIADQHLNPPYDFQFAAQGSTVAHAS